MNLLTMIHLLLEVPEIAPTATFLMIVLAFVFRNITAVARVVLMIVLLYATIVTLTTMV